jgi:hypothetical protein
MELHDTSNQGVELLAATKSPEFLGQTAIP